MFISSILLVLFSSYLMLSAFFKEKDNISEKGRTGFICFLLIAFAQIVLTFEILSLFKSISKNNFFISNIVFFIISLITFLVKSGKLYKPYLDLKRFLFVLEKDKVLIFACVCFVFFFIFQLMRIFLFPVNFGDALAYYLPRCTAWIQQGSILHFITPDSREIIMPVNMEFLYTLLLLFTKSEMGAGFFSFIGYTGAIYVIYNLLKELKFTIRRRIWSVIVFSSFALVLIEMVKPCADLFVGALILACIYLFLKSAKNHDMVLLYFSSLAYALAVGTKTNAVIAIPSVFIILCIISYLYDKPIFYKRILTFCGLFLLNFFVFSSYNYILNLIQFSNPFSNPEQLAINQFTDGIKGYIANVVKYTFVIFDMSGIPKFMQINGLIEYWQSLVLSFLGTSINAGTSSYFAGHFEFGNKMGMMHSALGINGLLIFLPSLIYSIKRGIRKKSKEAIIMAFFALSVVFNILLFSRIMVFTSYNMRYLLTFAVIASPVIVYSYPLNRHKFCKIFLCLILFMYLVGFSHQKPVSYIIECIKKQKIVNNTSTTDEENDIYGYFANKGIVNIALIANQSTTPIFCIEKLKLFGYKIDKLLLENVEAYNLSKYNYIITNKNTVSSTNIVNYKERSQKKFDYISSCIYTKTKSGQITTVDCEIPFEYFQKNGFVIDNNYQGKKYTILYKK